MFLKKCNQNKRENKKCNIPVRQLLNERIDDQQFSLTRQAALSMN
jgi:hypothetical protein